jgi:multiple antibiotic resistance protein
VGVLLLAGATSPLWAQAVTSGIAQSKAPVFSLGEVFTLLFVTIGPMKVIGPFAAMTRGRDRAFKRQLAWKGIVIAAISALAAATVGVNVLRKWGVSFEALLLTAGIVLFLVALRAVMEQYSPETHHAATGEPNAPAPTVAALAFSPLAFPTLVTPYGIAILIMLVTPLPSSDPGVPRVLAIAAAVLALDLLAMLFADRILASPFAAAGLRILGATLSVLQIALGVQAIVGALRLLGVIGDGIG